MKPDNANSAASSAATSPNKPGRPATEARANPTSAECSTRNLSEAEFLKRQADDAKAALAQTFAEMKAKLAEGANPVEWAREYPWVSLGVAAAAGFIGTTLVVPSREQQALAKLAAIEKALNPPKPQSTNHETHGKPGTSEHSLGMTILREVLAIVRPILLSLLTAGIAGRNARPSEAEMEAAAANQQANEPAVP